MPGQVRATGGDNVKQDMSINRVVYLKVGEAEIGQHVYLKSGRRDVGGTITAIDPAKRASRPRGCSIKVGNQQYRRPETELFLLVAREP